MGLQTAKRFLSYFNVNTDSAHILQQPTPQRQVVSTKMNSLTGHWPLPVSRCPQVGSCQGVQMTGREGRRDEGGEEEEEIKVDRLTAIAKYVWHPYLYIS